MKNIYKKISAAMISSVLCMGSTTVIQAKTTDLSVHTEVATASDELRSDMRVSGVYDTQLDTPVTTIKGKTITKNDVQNKHRMYVFFSTQCGYCQATLQTLAETDYVKDPNVQIILFSMQNTVSEEFVSNMGIENYDIVAGMDSKIHVYPSGYYPIIIFIDPNGEVNSATCGMRTDTSFFERIYGYKDITGLVNLHGADNQALRFNIGDTEQFNVGIEPTDASDQILTWQTSDDSIATIDSAGMMTAVSAGTVTITAKAYNGISASANVTVMDAFDIYRMYNPNSGEHFYTKEYQENIVLQSAGWIFESVGWYAPKTSATPVYRMYNPNAGEHHYTTNQAEKEMLIKAGWNDEGIAFYSDDNKTVPLYRQYNPNQFANNHNYTTSKGENDWLISLGWKEEGIGWYGM